MTTTQSVWDSLAHLPVGTIVAWGSVIIAIVATVATTIAKLYKFFKQIHGKVEDTKNTKERMRQHDEMLADINKSLRLLNEATVKSIRHDLVISCESALDSGTISALQLRSLEELYESYEDVGGNSYASTLMKKVRRLPITGMANDV